jgi:hypothetical protein
VFGDKSGSGGGGAFRAPPPEVTVSVAAASERLEAAGGGGGLTMPGGGVAACGAGWACAVEMIAGTVKPSAADAADGTATTARRRAIFRIFEASIIEPSPN